MKSSILTFVIVLTTTINFSQTLYYTTNSGSYNVELKKVSTDDSLNTIYFSEYIKMDSITGTDSDPNMNGHHWFSINNISLGNQYNDSLPVSYVEYLVNQNNWTNYKIHFNHLDVFGDKYRVKVMIGNVGIDDIIVDNGLKVYPNPVNDVCVVKTNEIVNVYDLTGQLLFTNENEKNTSDEVKISMNGFIPGIYIVRAGSSTFKVLKN